MGEETGFRFCNYEGESFPSGDFRRTAQGWEHVGSDPRHNDLGELLDDGGTLPGPLGEEHGDERA